MLHHATSHLIFKSCDDSIAKELRRAIENGKIGVSRTRYSQVS